MIACGACGRGHRSNEGVEKCKARAEKKTAAQALKRQDAERRLQNARAKPIERVIVETQYSKYQHGKLGESGSLFKAVARLKRDYPPPAPNEEWDIVKVIQVDNRRLSWPL